LLSAEGVFLLVKELRSNSLNLSTASEDVELIELLSAKVVAAVLMAVRRDALDISIIAGVLVELLSAGAAVGAVSVVIGEARKRGGYL